MENKVVSLSQIISDILRQKDIDSLLEVALDRIKNILGAERATFYFFNEDTSELWSYVATALEIGEIRAALGSGIVGKASKDKKLLNIKNAYTSPYFNKEVDKKTGYITKTVICVPLLDRDGKLLGAIQVLNKKEGCFTQLDEENFKNIALYVSIALDNVKLLQETETLLRSALYALAQAIDVKDTVTSGHSYRVAYFAVKMAKELGFSDEQLKIIEYAAYLHDVGKIGIPDNVLNKKDKLSSQEYDLMKKHPLHTLQILKNIIFTRESRIIPLAASCHHEFLDGSGYPFGFKDEQINIFSRIIAVADIYDALSSFDRPYKKALKPKEALDILKEETARNHLDKKIVKIFITKELYKYEQRKYKRIDLNTSVSYKIIPQKRLISEKIVDSKKAGPSDLDIWEQRKINSVNISPSGVLLLTDAYMPVGTYLDLGLDLSFKKIRCIGKVVWTDKSAGSPCYRVGVNFVNVSSAQKRILSGQLEKINKTR
jgi:HD-GYP domain-containing protein (c-di-GMP phosphodiesterase class II)